MSVDAITLVGDWLKAIVVSRKNSERTLHYFDRLFSHCIFVVGETHLPF
jgi:hypothetical protein